MEYQTELDVTKILLFNIEIMLKERNYSQEKKNEWENQIVKLIYNDLKEYNPNINCLVKIEISKNDLSKDKSMNFTYSWKSKNSKTFNVIFSNKKLSCLTILKIL